MTDLPNEVPDPEPAEAPGGPGADLPPSQPGEDLGVVDDGPVGGAEAGGDAPV